MASKEKLDRVVQENRSLLIKGGMRDTRSLVADIIMREVPGVARHEKLLGHYAQLLDLNDQLVDVENYQGTPREHEVDKVD